LRGSYLIILHLTETNNINVNCNFLIYFLLLFSTCFAQVEKSIFHSMEEALKNASDVKILHLENNKTLDLKGIDKLTHIEVLRIKNCTISELLKEIGTLKRLRSFSIINTNLNVLPNAITDLVKLEDLLIYECKLKSLPDSIGKLINLKALLVSNNQLRILPSTFTMMLNLKML